jgi:hypothetical protein
VIWRIVNEPLPDPRTLNTEVSDVLAEIILASSAKDPVSRPDSASVLLARLAEAARPTTGVRG